MHNRSTAGLGRLSELLGYGSLSVPEGVYDNWHVRLRNVENKQRVNIGREALVIRLCNDLNWDKSAPMTFQWHYAYL